MKPKLLFKSNKDVCFEKVDIKDLSIVTVHRNDHVLGKYYFKNTKGVEFTNPYISWENLNCCGGWVFDQDYLKDIVQKNKKICAGIIFKDSEEMETYISKLDIDKYHYVDTSWGSKNSRLHLIDLVRKGKLSDYYKIENIISFYELLGLNWDEVNMERFNELFHSDLYDIINGSKNYEYSSVNKTVAENIFTGLLLGYPLESTMSYMTI